MTDWEATQLRLKQRTEDARQRADEVRQRYVELGRRVGSSRQQVNRAAQAAREATDNAVAAQEALIERLEESASAHEDAAAVHDRAAADRCGQERVERLRRAEALRAVARRNRTEAARLAEQFNRTALEKPGTVTQLFRALGVKGQPITKQFDALVAWLADHEPSRDLWLSMVANGYGLQLEQSVGWFHRPVPYRRITSSSGTKEQMLI